MLHDGKGMLFFPTEDWRMDVKRRTHMLNQNTMHWPSTSPKLARKYCVKSSVSWTKTLYFKVRSPFIMEETLRLAKTPSSISTSLAKTMQRLSLAKIVTSVPTWPSQNLFILCSPTNAVSWCAPMESVAVFAMPSLDRSRLQEKQARNPWRLLHNW